VIAGKFNSVPFQPITGDMATPRGVQNLIAVTDHVARAKCARKQTRVAAVCIERETMHKRCADPRRTRCFQDLQVGTLAVRAIRWLVASSPHG
jgi:hypothetical protein